MNVLATAILTLMLVAQQNCSDAGEAIVTLIHAQPVAKVWVRQLVPLLFLCCQALSVALNDTPLDMGGTEPELGRCQGTGVSIAASSSPPHPGIFPIPVLDLAPTLRFPARSPLCKAQTPDLTDILQSFSTGQTSIREQ